MSVKLLKAMENTNLLPSAQIEIVKLFSNSQGLVGELSIDQLEDIVLLMNKHWHNSKDFRNNEIDQEGCFWSEIRNKLIEFD